MKRFVFKIQTALLVVFLLTPSLIQLSAHALPDDRFSDEELDELLAPIALYPDPLLAQVVPASTFIDQLEEAQRTLGGSTDDNQIGNQNWDVSVKSVAHYPQILDRMVLSHSFQQIGDEIRAVARIWHSRIGHDGSWCCCPITAGSIRGSRADRPEEIVARRDCRRANQELGPSCSTTRSLRTVKSSTSSAPIRAFLMTRRPTATWPIASAPMASAPIAAAPSTSADSLLAGRMALGRAVTSRVITHSRAGMAQAITAEKSARARVVGPETLDAIGDSVATGRGSDDEALIIGGVIAVSLIAVGLIAVRLCGAEKRPADDGTRDAEANGGTTEPAAAIAADPAASEGTTSAATKACNSAATKAAGLAPTGALAELHGLGRGRDCVP